LFHCQPLRPGQFTVDEWMPDWSLPMDFVIHVREDPNRPLGARSAMA